MVLVQCKCGGFFTIPEIPIFTMGDYIEQIACTNCGSIMETLPSRVGFKAAMKVAEEQGFRFTRIPDNATVTVKFDL